MACLYETELLFVTEGFEKWCQKNASELLLNIQEKGGFVIGNPRNTDLFSDLLGFITYKGKSYYAYPSPCRLTPLVITGLAGKYKKWYKITSLSNKSKEPYLLFEPLEKKPDVKDDATVGQSEETKNPTGPVHACGNPEIQPDSQESHNATCIEKDCSEFERPEAMLRKRDPYAFDSTFQPIQL